MLHESSEMRRLNLLPQTPPLAWDELMVQPQYMHAMDCMAAL
jgi:beta-N-acetylhexosaminidase